MVSEKKDLNKYENEFFIERDSDINQILTEYFEVMEEIKEQIDIDRKELRDKYYGKSYLNIIGKTSVIEKDGKKYKITSYI